MIGSSTTQNLGLITLLIKPGSIVGSATDRQVIDQATYMRKHSPVPLAARGPIIRRSQRLSVPRNRLLLKVLLSGWWWWWSASLPAAIEEYNDTAAYLD
jgi:hypothetical protein